MDLTTGPSFISTENPRLSVNYEGAAQFLLLGDLRLVSKKDLGTITSLGCPMKTLAEFGFVLTDSIIMQHLQVLLREDEAELAFVGLDAFTDQKDGRSLVEEIAKTLRKRNAAPRDLERFLNWVVSWPLSFEQQETLRSCKFLPVVGGDLMAPVADIFIPPRQKKDLQSEMDGENSYESDDVESEEEDDLEEASDQLKGIRSSLHFLDDCLVVRQPNGRLTLLGRSLKPDDPKGFVRRPRAPDLIRYAIRPALHLTLHVETDYAKAVRLLETVVVMLHGPRPETSIASAKEADFPLPAAMGLKHWRPASELYFGRGWMESVEDEELLLAAIGSTEDKVLLGWPDFKAIAGDKRGLQWWRRGLELMGVAKLPRIIVRQVRGRPSAPFKASHYKLIVNSTTLPAGLPKAVEPYWHKYLQSIEQKKANYASTYITYDFDYVAWIEGLEDERCRSAVVDLILKYPESYQIYSATLHRSGSPHDNASRHDVLWVHALRSEEDWKVFRSADGERVRPDDLWLVEHREKGPETRYAHLRNAAPGFDKHQSLLTYLGVSRLEDGDAKRIVKELHRHSLPDTFSPGINRASES